MTTTHVPVFSLSHLHNGDRRDELRRCASELGVFYLRDHGIFESTHERVRAITMRFFEHADAAEKAAVTPSDPSIRRGYSRLEGESTAKVTNTGLYSDYSTCYSMGVADNLFPSSEFGNIWISHFNEMNHLALQVARAALSTTSDTPGSAIESLIDCQPVLRFRFFPEVPEHRCAEHQPLRMAPHYDLSILTLIHQTACENGFVSLQFEAGGDYVDLPPLPGSIIVMFGAVATLVTHGRIKAPRHRVSAPTLSQRVGSSRTSSVFFLRPNPDFEFSVPLAKACGFETELPGATATFQEWIAGNYINMHARPVVD